MQKLGKQTIKFDTPPSIIETASIVGPKESEGPLAKYFDTCLNDEFWGEKTWEKAESKIIKEAISLAINKSKLEICLINVFPQALVFVVFQFLISEFLVLALLLLKE